MKLERIVPGSHLAGIAGAGAVEVVATRSYGSDAVEVTWRGPDGLGDRILYREDEPRIREVSPGRRWGFDADADAFRLASEALRIGFAHLFDPYAAVNASHIAGSGLVAADDLKPDAAGPGGGTEHPQVGIGVRGIGVLEAAEWRLVQRAGRIRF